MTDAPAPTSPSRSPQQDGPAAAPPAVLLKSDCITALQTARLLRRRGVTVYGVTENRRHYCCRSRAYRQIIQTSLDDDALLARLGQLRAQFNVTPVLVPCSDLTALFASRHRSRLEEDYRVPVSDYAITGRLTDKLAFTKWAIEQNLPIPPSFVLEDASQALAAARSLVYPAVLKPPVKTARWEAFTRQKVYRVESPEDLIATYHRISAYADVLLAQQWIAGPEANLFSFNGYFDRDSRPLVTFVARKERQWPPETGTSCLGEECRNEAVRQIGLELFRKAGFHGLAYVEVKRHEQTGEHFIVEPNVGRPTGRSALAEQGGVELVYTMYCDAANLPLPANREQKYGKARWIYLRRDMQAAARLWWRGDLSVRQWWRSVRGPKHYAVLDWRDPQPFVWDLIHVARSVIKSGKGRVSSRRPSGQPITSPPPHTDRSA